MKLMRRYERIIIIGLLLTIAESVGYTIWDAICSLVIAILIVYIPVMTRGLTGFNMDGDNDKG